MELIVDGMLVVTYDFRKLSDWGLTHRGLVLRRFDGILRDFADLFSESLNPNRLNPNHFTDFSVFPEFCGFAEFCGFVYGILRNFVESLNPNRLNPNRLTADTRAVCCDAVMAWHHRALRGRGFGAVRP